MPGPMHIPCLHNVQTVQIDMFTVQSYTVHRIRMQYINRTYYREYIETMQRYRQSFNKIQTIYRQYIDNMQTIHREYNDQGNEMDRYRIHAPEMTRSTSGVAGTVNQMCVVLVHGLLFTSLYIGHCRQKRSCSFNRSVHSA